MKTTLLLLASLFTVFTSEIQGQNSTVVYAQNTEISDNLDLRIVASVFGDSRNLQEFERRLNDPNLKISNLDLNYDGRVDYLRVIESVHKKTHIIIIQSVLNRDLYQDVATIEVEKNWINNIQIQVVGNSFFYGPNYIYEPVYYNTPLIYANLWMYNYQPYYSSWCWNYYPINYYAWNTYPVNRYRYNVNVCLNNYSYNQYNYSNYRRSSTAANIYYNSRSNAYERQHPNKSFTSRNTTLSNRYDLDQARNSKNGNNRNEIAYAPRRNESTRENTSLKNNYLPENNSSRTSSQRGNSQNRTETPRETVAQRTSTQNDYSQYRTETSRESAPQRMSSQRDYSQNKTETARESASQRTSSQRDYSQNRTETPREAAPQRTETSRESNSSRNSSSVENTNSSRGGNRRT